MSDQSLSAKPLAWCLLAAVLFGASTPASKALVGDLGPFTLAGLLYLGAALAVAPFAFRGGAWPSRPGRTNTLRLGGAVLFGGVLGPVLLLMGLSSAPASSVALWLNLETPATVLLGWLFFREHVSLQSAVGVGLIMAASLLLALPFEVELALGGLLVGAGCLCCGLDNNLTATIDGFTASQSTFVKGLLAGSTNLALGLWVDGLPEVGWNLGAALIIGALAYGASLVLYVAGAQQLGATRSQAIFATAPFWGVAVAWGAFAEPILAAQIGAAVLMGASLWVMHRERHGHVHTHEPVVHTHWHRHDDAHHDHEHDASPGLGWHCHEHEHGAVTHDHVHKPDIHHRHTH